MLFCGICGTTGKEIGWVIVKARGGILKLVLAFEIHNFDDLLLAYDSIPSVELANVNQEGQLSKQLLYDSQR